MSEEVHTVELVQPPQPTAMRLLEMAVGNNANIDMIERLVALQEHMQENEAKVQFNKAMNRVQECMGPVAADLENPSTRSRYASYTALNKRIRPIYIKEGFALSFDTAESPLPDHVRVLCYVSHQAGFVRTYHIDIPSDGKGAKGNDVMTKTHATGAAVSYGKRYLLIMIFNIAVGEDDSDGNAIDQDEIERNCQYITSARTAEDLLKFFGEVYTPAYNAKPQKRDACKAYIAAREARQKELQ